MLTVSYTNWGEPYAEGVWIAVTCGNENISVSLERDEAERLHDLLGRLLQDMR